MSKAILQVREESRKKEDHLSFSDWFFIFFGILLHYCGLNGRREYH